MTRNAKNRFLISTMLVPFCLLLALLFCPLKGRAANKGGHERTRARMVNLEATCLVHALKMVRWNEKDLPARGEPVKCLVVGKDPNNFSQRISFLLSESNTTISGRGIMVLGVNKIKDALAMTQGDEDIVLVVVLESAAGEWSKSAYPKRSGLLVYGQGERFSGSGTVLFSRISNNRVKFSVNPGRAESSGLELSPAMLSHKRAFSVEQVEN